ncbi:MAG: ATP-binding cassette domain-containing protein [Clostridia bacterium]|nr:ATP-binding cassette domain-containing protein [Clostridia bacterium]
MLEIKNVSFNVREDDGEKEILRNVTLTVPDRKLIVITGPNGGGKSTLAKLIAGIERPSEGSITFNGEDITNKNITERAQAGIAFAFQHPVRFKGIRVLDLLRLATGKNASVAEACEMLSQVGLCAKEYINREVNDSLSGGELKRIEIATVIARGAKLSVFDEPEAGIDLWSFQNLIKVFRRMRADIRDSSIVIISHQERILKIADEIVVLKDGKIDRTGTPDELFPMLSDAASVSAPCRMAEED